MTNKPKWKSNSILSRPLEPFKGDCSLDVHQKIVRHQREAKFELLFKHYGLSPNKPGDALEMVGQLALEHITGFQMETRPSKKADQLKIVEDIILFSGIAIAKKDDPARSEIDIIRAIAKWNGWIADLDDETVEMRLKTKWRRYQNLKNKNSPEYQRLAGFLRGYLPEIEAHLEEIEQNIK